MVLGVDEGVADEADVGHDAHEFFGRHGGPDVAVHLGVVHLFIPTRASVGVAMSRFWFA